MENKDMKEMDGTVASEPMADKGNYDDGSVGKESLNSELSENDSSADVSSGTEYAENEPVETRGQDAKEGKSGFLKKKEKNAKKVEALLQEKDKLAAEKAEIHDKYIRLYSEFDNYRRRTQKEKLDIIKNASENIILGILPVLDDMERALKYEAKEGESADVTDSEKEGISLIYNKLKTFLKQQGLEEITAVGEPFDVDLHEAITSMPAPDESMKGKILDEIQKGYKLNDKVIRFSKVVIYQ